MKENINSVSDYIKWISKIISEKNDDTLVVYRGEGQVYPTHCQPNLFRGDHLKKNKYFEKNLFDEMTANKLTHGGSYLEKAIDAQHGGFPSRLLDVTYNSLVALYFATTPEPSKPEDNLDIENGIVYIYFIEKLFCPSGDNIISIYDSIVKRDKEWFSNQNIFQKNHKLIDHIKTNKRIIAQQGAFILFQGDVVSPIPEAYYKKIEIDHGAKSKIRQELKDLFGIHTGSIYPEPSNLVKYITNKSYIVNCSNFDLEAELDLVISNLERELEFFIDKIIEEIYHGKTDVEITKEIMKMEEIIFDYKNGIEEMKADLNGDIALDNDIKIHTQKIKEIICKYNDLIRKFYESIRCHISELKIEFALEELEIGD